MFFQLEFAYATARFCAALVLIPAAYVSTVRAWSAAGRRLRLRMTLRLAYFRIASFAPAFYSAAGLGGEWLVGWVGGIKKKKKGEKPQYLVMGVVCVGGGAQPSTLNKSKPRQSKPNHTTPNQTKPQTSHVS